MVLQYVINMYCITFQDIDITETFFVSADWINSLNLNPKSITTQLLSFCWIFHLAGQQLKLCFLQVENIGVSLELIYVLKSSVAVQGIAFIANQNTQRKGKISLFSFCKLLYYNIILTLLLICIKEIMLFQSYEIVLPWCHA